MNALSARRDTAVPLTGLRVLDLSGWWAGAFVGFNLAVFGAEVIKLEAIQRVDGSRGRDSFASPLGYEKHPPFLAHNLGKLGITLDLSRPEGRAVLKQLVRTSDVLVNNYGARVMGNFGLTYEVLREENPALIMMSMPGFGMTGPWKDYVGFAYNMEQLSGIAHLTGWPDGPPTNVGSAADPMVGLFGLFAVFAALEHRSRTGEGQFIDVSHLEALTSLVGPEVLDYQMTHVVPTRSGNRSRHAAPSGCYPCKGDDDWVAIAAHGEGQWERLCTALGEPAWCRDERFSTLRSRLAHQDELDELLATWTRERTADEAMRLLQGHGIPAGAVLTPAKLRQDRHLHARNYFQTLDREHVGTQAYDRLAFRVDGAPLDYPRPAPLLGEHNTRVLKELLGIGAQGYGALEAAEVIGNKPVRRGKPA